MFTLDNPHRVVVDLPASAKPAHLPAVSPGGLVRALRSVFSDEVDPVATGAEMTRRWHDGLERALRARDAGAVPKGRVVDVLYREHPPYPPALTPALGGWINGLSPHRAPGPTNRAG